MDAVFAAFGAGDRGARAGPGDDEQPHRRRARLHVLRDDRRRPGRVRDGRRPVRRPRGDEQHAQHAGRGARDRLPPARGGLPAAPRLRRRRAPTAAATGSSGACACWPTPRSRSSPSAAGAARPGGPAARTAPRGAPRLNGEELPAKWRGCGARGRRRVDRDPGGRRPRGAARARLNRGAAPGPRARWVSRPRRGAAGRRARAPSRSRSPARGRRSRRRGSTDAGSQRGEVGAAEVGARERRPVQRRAGEVEALRRAPSQRASVRSASRRRTSRNDARRRSAPRRATKDQSPPSTFSSSYVQRSNVLPTSLQPVNVASKKRQRGERAVQERGVDVRRAVEAAVAERAARERGASSGGVGEVDADERHALVAPVGEVAALPVLVGDLVRRAGAHAGSVPGEAPGAALSRRGARCRAASRGRSTAGASPAPAWPWRSP